VADALSKLPAKKAEWVAVNLRLTVLSMVSSTLSELTPNIVTNAAVAAAWTTPSVVSAEKDMLPETTAF
jgi:hypothetical protein